VFSAKNPFGRQLIVGPAKDAQVRSGVRATERERNNVIDLKVFGRRASFAVDADKRASASVSREYAIANSGRDVS
jgi:hypothetical protein